MASTKTYLRRNGASPVYQFHMRVPQAVLETVRGRTVLFTLPPSRGEGPVLIRTTIGAFAKFSLRTRNLEVAKARESVARFELQKIFNAALKGPSPISQKQMVALAGCVYRLFIDVFGENPGAPDRWAAWKAFNRAAGEGRIADAFPVGLAPFDETDAAEKQFGGDLTAGVDALPRVETMEGLEARFGEITNWVLAHHDLDVDEETRKILLVEVFKAAQDAGWRLKRNARGDYRPDPAQERFPPLEKHPQLTLSELFARWKAEVKPAASTVVTWGGVIRAFAKHLGRENLRRINNADVIAFKDALVASGLKAKTINDTYLAALRTIFNFGVANKLLTQNPADKVRMATRRAAAERRLPYDDEEVGRLLEIARQETNPARRWLPWLSAFTGARIGELSQLWGENVKLEKGVHFIEIRAAADGGSLKNPHSERKVPLHPALIKEGFLEFVKAQGNGPLFYRRSSSDPNKRHVSKGVSNHLAEWIREKGFRNPRKAPNHAFRHWWKTTAARIGIQDSLADAIQGHAGRSVAETYRHLDLKTMAQAVAAIPVPGEETNS